MNQEDLERTYQELCAIKWDILNAEYLSQLILANINPNYWTRVDFSEEDVNKKLHEVRICYVKWVWERVNDSQDIFEDVIDHLKIIEKFFEKGYVSEKDFDEGVSSGLMILLRWEEENKRRVDKFRKALKSAMSKIDRVFSRSDADLLAGFEEDNAFSMTCIEEFDRALDNLLKNFI